MTILSHVPWLKEDETVVPLVGELARRVLAVPAALAQSKRPFSLARLLVTRKSPISWGQMVSRLCSFRAPGGPSLTPGRVRQRPTMVIPCHSSRATGTSTSQGQPQQMLMAALTSSV